MKKHPTTSFLPCIGKEKILQSASLGETYLSQQYFVVLLGFPSSLRTMEAVILSYPLFMYLNKYLIDVLDCTIPCLCEFGISLIILDYMEQHFNYPIEFHSFQKCVHYSFFYKPETHPGQQLF